MYFQIIFQLHCLFEIEQLNNFAHLIKNYQNNFVAKKMHAKSHFIDHTPLTFLIKAHFVPKSHFNKVIFHEWL